MSGATLSRPGLWSYGALGLPLAMAALPIYVHVPKYYGDTLGLDLAVVGAILLALRLIDCLTDPLLGTWSDRFGMRPRLIGWTLAPLGLATIALFSPPSEAGGVGLGWWLAASLAIVHAAYSLATINHHAWGSELSSEPHERTRVTATREGLALGGVLVAAVVPGLFADPTSGMEALSWVLGAMLLICGGWTVLRGPRPRLSHASAQASTRVALRAALGVPRFRRLLAVYLVNGTAAAMPATLVLFFIKDVIGAESMQGWFLALYFCAGAAAMPLWVAIAGRFGKARAWIAAMLLAVATFVWAAVLGPGDAAAFLFICAASGIALSADLALAPSMLADAIDEGPAGVRAGTYFGLWTLATKLNLALAAGTALPLVQWLGYSPGMNRPYHSKGCGRSRSSMRACRACSSCWRSGWPGRRCGPFATSHRRRAANAQSPSQHFAPTKDSTHDNQLPGATDRRRRPIHRTPAGVCQREDRTVRKRTAAICVSRLFQRDRRRLGHRPGPVGQGHKTIHSNHRGQVVG